MKDDVKKEYAVWYFGLKLHNISVLFFLRFQENSQLLYDFLKIQK